MLVQTLQASRQVGARRLLWRSLQSPHPHQALPSGCGSIRTSAPAFSVHDGTRRDRRSSCSCGGRGCSPSCPSSRPVSSAGRRWTCRCRPPGRARKVAFPPVIATLSHAPSAMRLRLPGGHRCRAATARSCHRGGHHLHPAGLPPATCEGPSLGRPQHLRSGPRLAGPPRHRRRSPRGRRCHWGSAPRVPRGAHPGFRQGGHAWQRHGANTWLSLRLGQALGHAHPQPRPYQQCKFQLKRSACRCLRSLWQCQAMLPPWRCMPRLRWRSSGLSGLGRHPFRSSSSSRPPLQPRQRPQLRPPLRLPPRPPPPHRRSPRLQRLPRCRRLRWWRRVAPLRCRRLWGRRSFSSGPAGAHRRCLQPPQSGAVWFLQLPPPLHSPRSGPLHRRDRGP